MYFTCICWLSHVVVPIGIIPRRRGRGPGIENIYAQKFTKDSANLSNHHTLIKQKVLSTIHQLIYLSNPYHRHIYHALCIVCGNLQLFFSNMQLLSSEVVVQVIIHFELIFFLISMYEWTIHIFYYYLRVEKTPIGEPSTKKWFIFWKGLISIII